MKNAISIVVPVVNEQLVFANLKPIEEELNKTRRNFEIICILDSKRQRFAGKLKLNSLHHAKVYFYPLERLGLGFAFCYGFNQSTGENIFFWEGNFNITSEQILLYYNLLRVCNADVVIGSKRHPLSFVYYSPLRRAASKAYQLSIKILFGLNVADTQVGFKLFKREVLEKVIPRIIIKKWAFDLEILVVAYDLGFRRIIEAPIEIKKHFTKNAVNASFLFSLFQDTTAIFYRKYILKYYQQKFV